MRTVIYFTGIAGTLLLMIRLIGNYIGLANPEIYLYAGLVLIVLICIPLLLVERCRHNKKTERIIKSYADQSEADRTLPNGKPATRGWGMNNSPFRERKSGLLWGGGNIKGANASSGKRRSFLK